MNVEFVSFPTLEEAETFYKKTTPKKWDEMKAKDPKSVTATGLIALEAFIDLWQLSTEDVYRVQALAAGKIAPPVKMAKSYGVLRLIEKKDADLKEYTDKKKEEYVKTLEQVYYYDKTQKVVQEIIERAAMKDYEKNRIVAIETSRGTIEVQLATDVAPKACENFMKLAEKKYYDGGIFHRVIKGFMIQGGDPTGTGRGGASIWGQPFEDEVKAEVSFDKAGLLAMANSGPNTNGSQFFITLAPTPHLNMKHTIFGEVISGMDVVKMIGETQTDKDDRPLTEQKILHMSLKQWPASLSLK